MKKLLKTSLITCLALIMCAISFTACNNDSGDHQHIFGDNWTYDEQYHWQSCTVEKCTEVSQKEEHQWVEKSIITEPSATSDGVAEKECSVCKAKENQSISFRGLSKDKWLEMISDASFENYTVKLEGTMTVTNKNENTTNTIKEIIKFADDKMAMQMFVEDPNSSSDDPISFVIDGDMAKAQKIQNTQLFIALLQEYESFVYDGATKTYKVPNTISIDTVLKGFSSDENGMVTIDVPAKLEMREAEVTVSNDGKLVKFVCDYSQTMTMDDDGPTTVSGKTTWEFYDYGTTVIS